MRICYAIDKFLCTEYRLLNTLLSVCVGPFCETVPYNKILLYIGRISEEESLFHYEGAVGGRRKRQTFEDFQNPNFTPIFFDNLTFTDEMRAACEEDLACLFDLAITSDMAFASNTLDQTKVANSTKAILSKWLKSAYLETISSIIFSLLISQSRQLSTKYFRKCYVSNHSWS